jgi:PAS domain S-box-containing protein
MNLYAIPSLIAYFINISMGAHVLEKDPKGRLNRIYFFLMMATATWCLGEFMMRMIKDPFVGTFWARITWSGVVFLPVLILHFSLALTRKKIKSIKHIGFLYLPSIFFLIIIITTDFFIYGVEERWWGFTAAREEALFYPLYLAYHISFIFGALFILYRAYTVEPKYTVFSSQLKFVNIGISIPAILGSIAQVVLPAFGIDIFPVASISTIGMAVFIGHAISKYKLMTIPLPMTAESIIVSMTELLFVVNPNNKIITVNKAALDILGYKEDELLGKPVHVIFGKKLPLKGKKLRELEEVGFIKNVETFILTKNKKRIPINLSASVVKDSLGKVMGTVYIARDMRKTKEIIDQLKKRTIELKNKVRELAESRVAMLNIMEDMDEMNRKLIETQKKLKKSLRELKKLDIKKDEFISMAAHELKTPLTTIHGFSQLLQSEWADKIKEKKKYLKILEEETERLSKLVNDMLDLSRIDLGTIKFDFKPVNLYDLIKNLKEETDMLIKEKGLKSEFIIEGGLPQIITDKERLMQIFLNLITNAVKYTPKGKIIVKVNREGNFIHFRVIDTGIGIPKKYHEKIFERFFQIESPYTRKFKGAGLGLSLTKNLIKLMGGKIWVESKVGKGSTFHFTLPIKMKRMKKELKLKE